MNDYLDYLQHSYKGTSWRKKKHKYLYIKKGRYYYAYDLGKTNSRKNALEDGAKIQSYAQDIAEASKINPDDVRFTVRRSDSGGFEFKEPTTIIKDTNFRKDTNLFTEKDRIYNSKTGKIDVDIHEGLVNKAAKKAISKGKSFIDSLFKKK